ncbi:MAG TPA: hypothetical protein VGS19_34980, partial [Streptosporangiaceae bacterium]|nr:hypothetical protein [Streptosporangiaceae bacterium]
FAGFQHTAFRLELQDAYVEPCEQALLAAFLAGHPFPAADVPEMQAWYDQVATQAREGKRVERVRVHREPPTGYQRFERSLDKLNLAAGESISYLTRQQAYAIGLLPAAGGRDWWLLDSSWLLLMSFDEDGQRIRNELTSDPAVVVQACAWRDLALHHAIPSRVSHVAA